MREAVVGPAVANTAPETRGCRHWRGHRDGDGVFWLWLDKDGDKGTTNTLSEPVLEEMEGILRRLEADLPCGLVLASAKTGGFVAGADVNEFTRVMSREQVRDKIVRVHGIFDRLAGLTIPTVAAIHGYCLGGGLELALACRYRVARTDATLGLPEVMLGIHPGFGGSARLTRLVLPTQAMKMMLSGRTVSARAARRLGLVDAVTETRHLTAAARAGIFGMLKTRRKNRFLIGAMNLGPARRALGLGMHQAVSKRVRPEHYPAPYALIDLWVRHGGTLREMLRAETESVPDLLIGDTAQNLIRAFFLRQRLKGLARAADRKARHIHVIGAGTMGGDIAAWAVLQGLHVTLQDREARFIQPAMQRAGRLFKRRLRDDGAVRAAFDRLMPDLGGYGVVQADVVIEAVPENLELKRSVFRHIEPLLKPDAVLATNTSSLPLEQLAEGLMRPERLIGLHFFNPVDRMPLVEVIRGRTSGEAFVARGLAFVGEIDRLPLPTVSAPGFLVNRALMPYLMEAVTLLDERIPAETIDRSAEAFGMPMGPIELADRVGLDVCLSVARVLTAAYGNAVPDRLVRLVEEGRLGVKSGRGFYTYRHGKPQKRAAAAPSTEIADRLLLPLLNTCVACLRERVVEDADLVDAGLIFGAGFAPFRGGPLRYAETRGVGDIKACLARFADRYGDRYRPDEGWSLFAKPDRTSP